MSGAAIIGAVQSRYEFAKSHLTFNELVYEVVAQLLEQTGVKMAEIHSMVTASQDFFDGKTISGMSVNEVVGAYLKSECKVAADGIQALLYAAARVMAGAFDYTLVVAHCMESTVSYHSATKVMFDPFVQRPLGFDDTLAAALQARRYMAAFGATPRDLARVSQEAHRNAMKNPFAQRAGDYTLDQILGSPVVADPLRELLVAPQSDGACALLLAGPEKAGAFGDRAVRISGLGNSSDAYWTDRELSESAGLRDAAARAYRMAGINDPRTEIHVAEIAARYAHEELIYAEALGFCETGKAAQKLIGLEDDHGGRVPVNPSGGALPGNPFGVAGLARVAEVWLQLCDAAGQHQIPGARVALAHGASGICGQNQTVVILRRNEAD